MNQLQPIQSILPAEEFSKLNDIKEELTDAWYKNQIFRTETEARYSVLNDFKFPTKASKYWQSVREQMVHFDELTRLSFDMRRKEIDIREIKDKMAPLHSSYRTSDSTLNEYQRLEIDLNEALFAIASMKRVAKDRVREVMQWSKFKKQFNDGSFDDKDVNTHQKESLFRSVLNRANASKPDNLSPEERLSIHGLLHMLKDEEVNKVFLASLEKKIKE